MSDLAEAIRKFPLSYWLSRHTQVEDTGGANFLLTCPVCGTKKFGVHKERKLGQCFKCSEGGAGAGVWTGRVNLVQLVSLYEKCDKRDAIRLILELSEVQLVDAGNGKHPTRTILPRLPVDSVPLASASHVHPSVQFLLRRGVSHLLANAHVCVTGPYALRIILPVLRSGELVGWEAKSYANGTPKSLFPDWFHTRSEVYESELWQPDADFCVVTESVLDAETVRWNALGIFGSVLRDGQLQRLLEMRSSGVRKLVWLLDGDAWRKQSMSVLRKTGLLFENFVCQMPGDRDPNDLGYDRCWQLIRAASQVTNASRLFFGK